MMTRRRKLVDMGLAAAMQRFFGAAGRAAFVAAACTAALILGSDVAVAQVVINPVLVELGARQRVVAVTVALSEKATAPIRLQAEILRWAQDVNGGDLTDISDDLLVTPPIADVRPGEKQVFRIALRGPRPGVQELTYRLILEDIAEPPPVDNAPGLTITFRMRYDLPVLVAPVGPIINALRWKPCASAAASVAVPTSRAKRAASGPSEACLRLFNDGNRRVKIQTLMLAGDGWQQNVALKEGVNVLAGAEREWRVPLQAAQHGALRDVRVQTVRGETLQAVTDGF